MEYYKIKPISIDRLRHAQKLVSDVPSANGINIPNAKEYFDRMSQGEIIQDAPVFDYFILQSFGPPEEWEWRKQDIHGYINVGSILTAWYISDKLKKILDRHKMAKGCQFYASKLFYKGEKYDYWIFQYAINPFQNYDYIQSEYYIEGESNRITGINNAVDYDDFDYKIYKEQKKNIVWKKTVLIDSFDLVVNINGDILVSEALKISMENDKIEGIEFKELEYIVEVNNINSQ